MRQPVPPRILLVGGSDHDLRIPFLLELAKMGFDVAAAGTCSSDPFARNGIRYYPYSFDRFANPLADWRALRDLRRIIAEHKPDIVHSFDTKPGILVPAAARARPGTHVMRTINGLGWLFSSQSLPARALRPAFNILHRATAPWTTLTVFQNRSDEAFFKERHMIGRGGSCLIPGSGADIANFEKRRSEGPSAEELRTALGLADAEVVITVTRLSRIKGIPALLEAAALVYAVRPGVRFLLVGSRETEGKLAVTQAEIDRHAPYVMAIGPRSDVPSLLSMADIFAFPTELCEGVPRVLLEAGLAGLPIVTTNMPGCPDVVEDGESGFVVTAGQPRQLADRILDLLHDRDSAHEMGQRARRRVVQTFSLEAIVDAYATAYERLAAGATAQTKTESAQTGSVDHPARQQAHAMIPENLPTANPSRSEHFGGNRNANV
ncbi:glycosyltransferase family 4 protein [Dichotomicrobium thermohalophilum]|uniref:glycosyltransferase family 4 protein n=1 Tax=Dichotomicrobium thermohalophilum TaxID=933063 RepID=UPI001FE1B7A0|nr:glycosyltransferase family 4 protein [Dichotomicrobium thermohalophilum]